HQARLNDLHQTLLKSSLSLQVQLGRIPPERAQDFLGVLGGAEFRLGIRDIARAGGTQKHHTTPHVDVSHLPGLEHVVQYPHDTQYRSGVNSLAQSLVVETHVAAGYRDFQFFAGLGHAVDHLRKLPHNVRLLRISEVQAVGCRNRSGAAACHVSGGLSHRVHGPEPRVEVAPAAVAVERHGQAALRALDANDTRVASTRPDYGVGLHHRVVLLPYPTLSADVFAGEKRFQIVAKIARLAQLNVRRHFARHRRLPAFQRTFIDGGVVGERVGRNFGHNLAVLQDAHLSVVGHPANFDRVQSPLFEDSKDFLSPAFVGHQQHALLGLAEHDFVGRHAGLALGNAVQLDLHPHVAARAHLAGGAGQAPGAHVLDADDRPGLHGLEAGFEKEFLQERIADLHVRPLGFRHLAELLAGHGGAVNPVAAGLGADVNHRVSFARGFGVEDLVAANQSERKRVYQGIVRITALKLGFSAEIRHAEAVPVRRDAAYHALHDGVILMDVGTWVRARLGYGPESQRIHNRYRPRAHGEDIPQNAAYPG